MSNKVLKKVFAIARKEEALTAVELERQGQGSVRLIIIEKKGERRKEI